MALIAWVGADQAANVRVTAPALALVPSARVEDSRGQLGAVFGMVLAPKARLRVLLAAGTNVPDIG